MPSNPNESDIAADRVGIHFLKAERAVTVHWGEISAICVLSEEPPGGAAYLRFFVDVFGGVDFQFTNVDVGYEQVTAEMEKHLIGFSRATAESQGVWDRESPLPEAWHRDESFQPFELRPPPDVPPLSSPDAAEVRRVWEAAGRPGPWDSFWLQMSRRLNGGTDGESPRE